MVGVPYEPFETVTETVPTVETRNVIRSIANWFLELEKVTFASIGSPCFNDDGTIGIGSVISRFVQQEDAPYYHGPFSTARERYIRFFDTAMEQILAGRRTLPQHVLVDYLTALELKTLVSGCKELEHGPWYIKHGEDKGDHFLVDDEGEIKGVIDWDW